MGSSEESGKDWSDLEREAAAPDRDASDFDDDSIDRKKKKGFGGSSRHDDRKR